MMNFLEYVARRQGGDPLGTPAEMLKKMGISPDVPDEVVLKRMVKRWKKREAVAKAHGAVAER